MSCCEHPRSSLIRHRRLAALVMQRRCCWKQIDQRCAWLCGGGSFLRAGGVLDFGRVAHARRRQGQAQAGTRRPGTTARALVSARHAARLQAAEGRAFVPSPRCLTATTPITHTPRPTCPETSPCASCIGHARAAPSAFRRRACCRSVSGARLCWHGRRARARPHTPRSVCAVHCSALWRWRLALRQTLGAGIAAASHAIWWSTGPAGVADVRLRRGCKQHARRLCLLRERPSPSMSHR